MSSYLAADLGAESGRVMLGTLAGGRLEIEEIRRFPNQPVELPSGLYWDAFRLFHEIVEGLTIAGRERHLKPAGIGVDTWGVDFGLLGADGGLIDCPRHYRDPRTNGVTDRLFETVPRAEVFARTGIQIMSINSLYQLYAARLANPSALDNARRLLFMPDLIHYLLTGVCATEKSIASTSQLLNPHTQTWEQEVIKAMGFPMGILGGLVDAGSVLGELQPDVAAEIGAKHLRVIAPAGHDTASAVVGVPAEEPEPVFLSSGTWSCMGRELKRPAISEASFRANFSNEGGAFGTTRLLKNIAGMWLLQESKRAWDAAGKPVAYDDLARQAEGAAPFAAFIDPDAADFQAPADMPAAMAAFCCRTGQTAPADFGGLTRVIFESLALKYRYVKESLAQITGKPIERIYIVGGGSQNHLLNQFTADALNCTVVAGPVEAASIGNLILQLYALGEIRSLAEGRSLIRRSFETNVFEPRNTGAWNDAYARFQTILSA